MHRSLFFLLLFARLTLPALAQEIALPEDPLEGRILFETRGCIQCHAIGGYGGDLGPDLGTAQYFGSFLGLVAAIWNHIPAMDRQYRLRRVPRPSFTEKEMLDLAGFIYYLRYLGEPGSVARGRQLLTDKRCVLCHGGSGGAPSFEALEGTGSPIEMVQAMWNHGPAMQDGIERLGVAFPTLTGSDVSDITSYLKMVATHQTASGTPTGNPSRGRTLFEAKQCARCHGAARTGNGPPRIDDMDLHRSVVDIAAMMWNHGPDMRSLMSGEGIRWPRFEGSEMTDLIAYLYFLDFQGDPGDAAQGMRVFEAKGCTSCHESGNSGVGPDLTTIRRLGRPERLAQLMWNHADEMEDLLLARNEQWPQLDEKELSDLLAYLKSISDRQ